MIDKLKELKEVANSLKEIEDMQQIYPVLSSDDTIRKRELKEKLYNLIEEL